MTISFQFNSEWQNENCTEQIQRGGKKNFHKNLDGN